MAKYMIQARYSRDAMNSILSTGSDREAAARASVEAAGGELLAFYGMLGQEHNLCLIIDVPGPAEYIGAIGPAIASGTLESWRTIPLFEPSDIQKGSEIAQKVSAAYTPPGG